MSEDGNIAPLWKLERVATGELAGTGSSEEQIRLKTLEASNREILETLPVDDVVREVERRKRVQEMAPARKPYSWRLAGLSAMVAVAAAVVVLPRISEKSQSNAPNAMGNPYMSEGTERAKGDERLLISVQREGSRATDIQPGDRAAAGDVLQLSYLAAGQRFGAIISIDSRGTVTRHLPETGLEPVALSSRGRTALPSSYELDDAPEFERFYFITSENPFDLSKILSAAEALPAGEQALALEDDLHQQLFSVRKVEQ